MWERGNKGICDNLELVKTDVRKLEEYARSILLTSCEIIDLLEEENKEV